MRSSLYESQLSLRTLLLVVALILAMAPSLPGQEPSVSYFLAPTYPPLARRASISGNVVLTLQVDKTGRVAKANVGTSSHPLLAQAALACAQEWKFHANAQEHSVPVAFYFSFSGKVVEHDPSTKVTAEFAGTLVRVFVSIDAAPATFHNDAKP